MIVALLPPQPLAAPTVLPQRYEVAIETGMPHLDENLRYATTREQHCLREDQLLAIFPLLRSPALAGCRLDRGHRREDTIVFALSCEDGNETSGTATWQLGEAVSRGILSVKLGGKNMTAYQRVSARRLRESC